MFQVGTGTGTDESAVMTYMSRQTYQENYQYKYVCHVSMYDFRVHGGAWMMRFDYIVCGPCEE